MERWHGKVAVVTGASAGIGLATAKALVGHGLIVVGFARRIEKMERDMKSVKGPGKFYARQCDLTKKESIAENLNWVKDTLGTINVLINNAGHMCFNKTIEEATGSDLDQILSVNLLGLLHATKHAIPILKSNQKEAHIINVNSVLGHTVLPVPGMNVYPASKFAVRALSETLSIELKESKIRVSSVSPGMVKTEMREKLLETVPAFAHLPALDAEDIASAIVYALSAPVHVQIKDIILEPKASN